MTSIYEDMNPDWANGEMEQPEWEPWQDDIDYEEFMVLDPQGCGYCGAPNVRDTPEPYGGLPCCDICFNKLIGDDESEKPFRCWNCEEAKR